MKCNTAWRDLIKMYLSNNFCQVEWTQGSLLPFICMEPGALFIDANGELTDSLLMVDLLQYKFTGFSRATASDLHCCERRIKPGVYSWGFVPDEAFRMHGEMLLVKISGHSLCVDHFLSCFEYSLNDHLQQSTHKSGWWGIKSDLG